MCNYYGRVRRIRNRIMNNLIRRHLFSSIYMVHALIDKNGYGFEAKNTSRDVMSYVTVWYK